MAAKNSYKVFGCEVHWSGHALDRVRERFGFSQDIKIPNRRLVNACSNVNDGDEFHIKTPLVTFVCKRDSAAKLVVVTVLMTV